MSARLACGKDAAIAAINQHVQRLSERVVEKTLREEIRRKQPGQPEIATGAPINISIDVAAAVRTQRAALETLINDGNLEEIIKHYPVRETSALTEIATKLGFKDRDDYEAAVRKLLVDDTEALTFVKALFASLPSDIAAA